MARPRRKTCRICGRNVAECGPLSARKKCQECALERMRSNLTDLMLHEGAHLLAWRRSIAASVGAVLLDDLPPRP